MTDLRYAFRQLIKSPSFSATAIFALGIGATTAMFAVLYAFLLRPLPFADPEKLVMLQSRSTRSGSDLEVNYLDFVDWQKQSRSFADMAFFNLRWNGNLESAGGMTETLKTTFTTANLFTLLGAIGLALGIGGAFLVSRVLNTFLFGIGSNDLISYAAACFLLASTAGIAALIPARRASLVDPMEALRTE